MRKTGYRRKSRRRARYARKATRRRRYSKKSRYTRTRYVSRLPVKGRFKIKGHPGRMNRRPEIKRLLYGLVNNQNPAVKQVLSVPAVTADYGRVIWALNGLDAQSHPWVPWPTQGVTQFQVIGVKYSILWADVRFTMRIKTDQDSVPLPYETIRLMIVRQRQRDNVLDATVLYEVDNTIFDAPIRSNYWQTQMDKLYHFNTGLQEYDTANGVTFPGSLTTPPKNFRIKIPIHQSMTLNATQTEFSLNVYIIAVAQFTSTVVEISDISAVYYYLDT